MSENKILLLKPGENLDEKQNSQFINIMFDAYKSKFQKELGNEPETVKKILNLMIKKNLFPLENKICAVDGKTHDVLGFILLSKFEDSGIINLLNFVVSLLFAVRIDKAIKLMKAFLKLDSLNTMSKNDCIADIYLIASKEQYRGQGIGTLLLDTGLKHVKETFLTDNGKRKIILIVYKDNPAVRLYKRFGFEAVETFDTASLVNVMGEEFHTHLMMQKTL